MTRYPLNCTRGWVGSRVGLEPLHIGYHILYFLNISKFPSDYTGFGIWDLVLSDILFVAFYLGDISKGIVHTVGLYYYGSGVDSVSNIHEYQEYFTRSKGGPCVRLTTLPPICVDCLCM